MALPIWATYMKSAYENEALGISMDDFEAPALVSIPIDCEEVAPNASNPIEKKEDLNELGF